MEFKAAVSLLVIALTFVGYVPYIRDILSKKTKPHVFTWFTVSITALIAYGLQVVGGAGIGAWPMLVVAVICALVFILSLKEGGKDITHSDILFLGLSISALVLWLIVKQPVLSVLLITTSEILSFVPTVRKSWNNPYSETLSLYEVSMFRHALAILALEKVNILTALYPAAWAITNGVIASILILRRSRIQKPVE